MTRPDPIHPEHCRCGQCDPRRPSQEPSPALLAGALAIVAGIVIGIACSAASRLHELLFTQVTF